MKQMIFSILLYISLIGTVKDTDDKPVAGALVYLYHTHSRGWYAADGYAKTMM